MLDKNFTLIICLVLLIVYVKRDDLKIEVVVAISAAVMYFFLYGEDMGLSGFGWSDNDDTYYESIDDDTYYESIDDDTYYESIGDSDDHSEDANYESVENVVADFEAPATDIVAEKAQYYDTVNDLYKPGLGCPGDDALAKKMKHMSMKNKAAIDARSRMTKYSFMHLFDEELNDHSNSRWWDNQDLEQYF